MASSPTGEVAASRTASKGSTVTDVISLILVLILAIVFLRDCFRRLALAPWFKVLLPDFFLGDPFTSQVLVFRNLEFIACSYYSGGFFLTQQDQCLRRYHDEKDKHQLQNAGKYMSAIIAVGLRQAYTNYRTWPGYELPLRVLFITASIIATVFTTYRDICHDWSLLKKSKNKWLL